MLVRPVSTDDFVQQGMGYEVAPTAFGAAWRQSRGQEAWPNGSTPILGVGVKMFQGCLGTRVMVFLWGHGRKRTLGGRWPRLKTAETTTAIPFGHRSQRQSQGHYFEGGFHAPRSKN